MLKFDRLSNGDCIHLINDGEKIVATNEEIFGVDGDTTHLFVSKTSHPKVFRYGARNLVPDHFGHGVGYCWSSRVGCLNLTFGTEFVEVVINNCAGYCMSTNDLMEIIPEGCYFERKERFDEKEPYYYLRGYKCLEWQWWNKDIPMLSATSPIEVDGENFVTIDGTVLMATNYEGIFAFDVTESISSRINYQTMKPTKTSTFGNLSDKVKKDFVEVYINHTYGYCATKKFLGDKFPNYFKKY